MQSVPGHHSTPAHRPAKRSYLMNTGYGRCKVWWASFANLVKQVQADCSLPVDDIYWSVRRVKHQRSVSVEATKRCCRSRDLYIHCFNTGRSWCSGGVRVHLCRAYMMQLPVRVQSASEGHKTSTQLSIASQKDHHQNHTDRGL